MDEHKGRQVAKKMGITITGTIGILTQAFDEWMLTTEGLISVIGLCLTCFGLGYVIGSKDSDKTQK